SLNAFHAHLPPSPPTSLAFRCVIKIFFSQELDLAVVLMRVLFYPFSLSVGKEDGCVCVERG
ncbi:MAG: hypothetical protein J7L30_01330, partial [Methanophagales archaeon]|nr:hypothetical protein [Methanophagales archaeon]